MKIKIQVERSVLFERIIEMSEDEFKRLTNFTEDEICGGRKENPLLDYFPKMKNVSNEFYCPTYTVIGDNNETLNTFQY